MNKNENVKPWLDDEGNYLTDKLLKKISKNWDQATWDEYLNSLEGGLKERSVSTKKYNKICELEVSSIFAIDGADLEKYFQIQKLIRKLTKKQQRAVKLYFFEQLTQNQIASRLKISVDSVKDRLSGAIKKLGILRGSYPIHCPIVRGENKIPIEISEKK